MAEKGFGVKEINLIGASGTPTIESPNNLNLNAVNVAISTNATIGGNLTVTGNIGIAGTLTYEDVTNIDAVGIVTAREGVFIPDNKKLQLGNAAGSADLEIFHDGSHSYVKDTGTGDLVLQGTNNVWLQHGNGENALKATQDAGVELRFNNIAKLATTNTGVTVTGTLAATAVTGDGSGLTGVAGTPADTDPQVVFDVSASGSSGYIFTGPGNDGSTVNPNIYLMRGQRYRFINTTGSSHPFEFRNADNSADFTDGITGSQSGTQDFNVQYDAPAHLKYRCTIHGSMIGNIYIRSGADTGASAGTENIEIGGFLRFDDTVSKIVTDTSDGSDDKAIFITGGGDTATSRGALAILYGNELNSGRLDLYSGVGGGDITFNTGTTTTEKLRITSGGQLELRKNQDGVTGRPDNRIVFKDTDTSVAANQPIGEISWYSTDAGMVNVNSYIRGINEATNGSGALTFGVKAAGSSEIEALRIDSNGRVLVGTTDATTIGTIASSLVVGSTTNNDEVALTLNVMEGANGRRVKFFLDDDDGVFGIDSTASSGVPPFVVRMATSEKLRITSAGKIGIGTDNPVSALDVRNASGTDPLLSLHHSEADVIGEVVRIGRVAPYHTIRYHSIKAEHSGGATSNMLAFHLHNGSTATSQTEVMRLRGDGRVGIGTDNPTTALEVKGDITVSNANNQADIFFGEHGDVADSKALIRMDQHSSTAGALQFHTESGGTLTERLRIDQNGSVIVASGTLHASRVQAKFGIDCHGLDIYDGVGAPQNYGMVFYNDPTTNKANGIGFFNDDGQSCGGYIVHQDKGGSNIGDIIFATSASANTPVERLRIASSGLIGINVNTPFNMIEVKNNSTTVHPASFRMTGAHQYASAIMDNDGTNGGGSCTFISHRISNSIKGDITFNGSVMVYGGQSDYRLKENVVSINDGIAKVKQLNPLRYTFISNPDHICEGFFAHEAQAVCPQSTTGVKDDIATEDIGTAIKKGDPVYQQMDYSKLVPLLTAALQEAITKIETLESKVATLEGS